MSNIDARLKFIRLLVDMIESFINTKDRGNFDMVSKCPDLTSLRGFFPHSLDWTDQENPKFKVDEIHKMVLSIYDFLKHLQQIVNITRMTSLNDMITYVTDLFRSCARKYHEEFIVNNIYHCTGCGYDICRTCGYCITTSASLCCRCAFTNPHLETYQSGVMQQISQFMEIITENKNTMSTYDKLEVLFVDINKICKHYF
jgi:hypothetical protein